MFYKKINANRSGRSFNGRITVRGRGGGYKRTFKFVNFYPVEYSQKIIAGFFFDTFQKKELIIIVNNMNLVSNACYFLKFENAEKTYFTSKASTSDLVYGEVYSLSDLPLGSKVYSISAQPSGVGAFARCSGTFGTVVKKKDDLVFIRLPSGKTKFFSKNCWARFGMVSSPALFFKSNMKKAGFLRNFGKRPKVRGVAINPVDHPHGGGEGKGYQGRPAVSPWGRMLKGKKK